MTTRAHLSLGVLVLLLVPACTNAPPSLRVEDAWVRVFLDQGAAYLVIHNDGDTSDRLIGAHAQGVREISLHQTLQEGEILRMRPVAALEVSPGRSVALEPKGYHLMLAGVPRSLKPGQKLPVVLEFARSGQVPIEAQVRSP